MDNEVVQRRVRTARTTMKNGKCRNRCHTCDDAEVIVFLADRVRELEAAERRRRRAKAES